jgi:hypothetical protein
MHAQINRSSLAQQKKIGQVIAQKKTNGENFRIENGHYFHPDWMDYVREQFDCCCYYRSESCRWD